MLKIRAWDVDCEEMVTLDDFIKEYGSEKFHNENLSAFFQHFFGCEIMQDTGLNDKNGFVIYEGDFIKMFDVDTSEYSQFVEFKFGSFGYMTGGKYSYFVSIAGNTNIEFNGENCMSAEVIGNIYENPELLEG